MKNDTIIYSLCVEDIQTVANEVLLRNLSHSEIKKIIDIIAEKINWYDAISDAISDTLIQGTFNKD
jgi:hypothetical protein